LHEMIWQLAGNSRMARTLDRLASPMIALQAKVYQPLLADLVQKEAEGREGSHRRIVDTICNGDSEGARTAMQSHVLGFWQMWLKHASIDGSKANQSREVIADAVLLLETMSTVFETAPKSSKVM